MELPESSSEDGLTYQGYLGPSWPRFWGVLGSMLRLLGSILAPTWRPRALQSCPRAPKRPPRAPKSRPRQPKIAQEPPKSRQRRPRSSPRAAQESPRAAQDSPRASQKPTKMPRSSPRLDQSTAEILPGTWPETTHYPRLEKTPNFTTHFFRTSFQSTKRPKSKTSGGGTPHQGASISFLFDFSYCVYL